MSRNPASPVTIAFLFAIFATMLALPLVSAEPVTGVYATIDDNNAVLGELVIIRLQPHPTDAVLLSISDGVNTFRYNGQDVSRTIGFQPQRTGEHKLTFMDARTGDTRETLYFLVSEARNETVVPLEELAGDAPPPPATPPGTGATSNEDNANVTDNATTIDERTVLPTRTAIINADKANYLLGETVTIAIGDPTAIRLNIQFENEVFRFLGELPAEVQFQPTAPGAYRAVASGPEGDTIDSFVFTVAPPVISGTSQTTGPSAPNSTGATESAYGPSDRTRAFEQSAKRYGILNARRDLLEGTLSILPEGMTEGIAADILDMQDTIITSARDIEFIPQPTDRTTTIQRVRVQQLLGNTLDLGLDEFTHPLPLPIGKEEGRDAWVNLYAVDPTRVNATSVEVTVVAQGTELHTCKDWDFANQACLGSWVKVRDLTPGEEYTITLDPSDPGFGETVPIPSGGWTNTITSTAFTVRLCKDVNCANTSTLFDQGEVVYAIINMSGAYAQNTTKWQLDIYYGADANTIQTAYYRCLPTGGTGPFTSCAANFTVDASWDDGWYYLNSEIYRTTGGGFYTMFRSPFMVGSDTAPGDTLKFFVNSSYSVETDIFPVGSQLYVEFNFSGDVASAANTAPYIRTFKSAVSTGTAATESFSNTTGPYRFNFSIASGLAGWYFLEPGLRNTSNGIMPPTANVHGRMFLIQNNTIPGLRNTTTNAKFGTPVSKGQTLQFNLTGNDTDEVDRWIIYLCQNATFNQATRSCTAGAVCQNLTYKNLVNRTCEVVANASMNFTNTAYAFVCDPRNCSTTGYAVNWSVYNDSTAPSISLVTPINDPTGSSPKTNFTQTFNYVPSDDFGFANCSLYTNETGSWAIRKTNTSIVNGTNNLITHTFPADGSYKWNVLCVDYAGNGGFGSSNYTLFITGPPIVYLTTPANASYTNGYNVNFTYNTTYSQQIDNCTLYINGVANETDPTITNGQNELFSTTFSQDGSYTWNVLCTGIDDVSSFGDGVYNVSVPRTFTIDTGYPNVVLWSPGSDAIINQSSATFIYTPNDSFAVQQCNLTVDGVVVGTANSPTNNANQSVPFLLNNGIHQWYVTCVDFAGNGVTSESRSFTINSSTAGSAVLYETDLTTATTYSPTAAINLSSNVDGTEAGITSGVSTTTTVIFARAISTPLQGNGILINASSAVNYSADVDASTPNDFYVTWKYYYSNTTSDTEICRSSNGGSAGTLVGTNARTTVIGSCVVNTTRRIQGTEWLKLQVDIYNIDKQRRSITHYIDSTNSFVNFTFTRLGVMTTDLLVPALNLTMGVNESLQVECAYNCSGGSCLNTRIYLERNTSTGWQTVATSGGVLNLNASDIDPKNLSTVTFPGGTVTFNLTTNTTGAQNLRCNATSDYSYALIQTVRKITVANTGFPSIQLNTPTNASYTSATIIQFNYTASANKNITNCSLYLNQALNATNTSITEDVPNFFNATIVPEGQYNWSVRCYDSDGDVGNSSTYQFTIDRGAPTITLNAPLNNSNWSTDTINFNWTATDGGGVNLTCNVTVNGTVRATNVNSNNGIPTNRTINNLSIGFQSWNVTCYDAAGNFNTSATWQFNITNLPTNVTLLAPANGTWNNSANILLSYNVTHPINDPPRNCSLYINGTFNQSNASAITMGGTNTFTVTTFTDGHWRWGVTCVDEDGTIGRSDNRTIIIDRTPPRINLTYPPNNTNMTVFNIGFQYNASDSMAGWNICNLTLDGLVNISNANATNNALRTGTINNIPDGIHNWSVTCVDIAGNYNTSVNYTFTAIAPPNVTLSSPVNLANLSNQSVMLIYNVSENNVLANCSLYLDGAFNRTNWTTLINNNLNNFSVNVTEGTHSWYVTCADTSGYLGTSATWNFSIDISAPNVTLNSPNDTEVVHSPVVTVNWTAIDNIDTSLRCNITRKGPDGTDNTKTNIATPNGTPTTTTYSGLPDGQHLWNVTCWDDASNRNFSTTWSFNVSSPPSVTLASPENDHKNNTGNITFSYVPVQSYGLANCTLLINNIPNQTNYTVTSSATNYFWLYDIGEATYNWSVNCTDNTGGSQNSSRRNFTVDKTPPLIALIVPANASIVTNNSVQFTYQPTDDRGANLNCSLAINGSVINTSVRANGTLVNLTTLLHGGNASYAWNVTCVDWAMNTNASQTWQFNVIAPPNVTLLAPANNSPVGPSMNFTYIPTDPYNLTNCSIIFDGIRNQTNTTVQNATNNTFTIDGINPGAHNWTVLCYDTDNDSFAPDPQYINGDNTPPFIALLAPANLSNFTVSNVTFNYTTWDDFSFTMTCRLYVDTINRSTNVTGNNTNVSVRVDLLTDGAHQWYANCSDSVGNLNMSETRNFTVNESPRVTLWLPPNATSVNNETVVFWFNVTDNDGFANCSVLINGQSNTSNQTPIMNNAANNITVNLTTGKHYWSVLCYDNGTFRNPVTSAERNITVNLYPPNVTLNAPPSGYLSNLSWIVFNWTANETFQGNLTCNVTINGTVRATNVNVASNQPKTSNITGINDTFHVWNVTCVDQSGNYGTSDTWNFTVAEPPVVTLNSPTQNYRTNNLTVNFTFTPTDNSGVISACSVVINGALNTTRTSVTNNAVNNITVPGFVNGSYVWYVNCTDFAGNTANSTNRTLLIDTYPPVINLTSPSNNSNTNANVTFRWNATDVGSVITCNLTVDGVNNVTGIVGVSGVQFERNITGIPPGTHLWNATCWDDLNQANTSETWTFSISNADLVLNESPRISFNNTNPNENQTILISANVTNIGGVDALTNTTFWDGDPGTGGTYIGSAVLNVPYNGSTVFSVAWNITNGNHEIHARADPAGSIVELLETNNNASRNISILKAYFNAPPNATLTSDTTPEVNFTLQDFTSGTLTYRIYVDGAYNGQTGTGTDNVSVLLNLSTLANGARSIIVQANDSSRAKNSTPLTIIVDNTPPQLAYVNATPADNHVQNTTSAIINVTHNETYPDTVILYWDGAQDTIKPYSGNFTNFTKTGLGDGIYTYYVWANDTLGNTNTTAARTLRVDFNAPNITLLAPANGSTVTSNAVPFVFNVNDSSQYVNCTLSINGTANKTINNLLTNTPQEIAQLLDDGTYLWGISCVDQMNRTNVSENRTVTVAFSPTIWQGIWFERYTANFPNATAIINLSNSRDNTENNMFKNVSGFGLATLANATSPYIGGMGAYIPAQTFTAFSGVFRSEGRDNYITWIASIVNDSGHFVIAQSGTNNDNNSGNNRVFPEDTKVTLSGNQTLGNAIYLAPLDRLELVVNTYNDHGNTWNTTHYWDFRSNSFVNFTTFYTLGKVIVNLTEPAGTTVVNPWAVFNMTCLANCTYGTCINTTVYAQYSTPSMNWTNINGTSGSLTLAAGQQNGISLGNLTNATNVTFSINGSQISSNTIRCAISSLANALAPGTPTQLVVVNDTEAPTVTLVSPPNNNHTRQVNITFSFNATDNIAIVNCSLFINGVFNQTNQSGITNGTPNNITVNDMAEGIYNWSVLCLDYNANPGWSAVWNLTIDKTSPAITLNAPNNSQNFTTRYVGLNYTPIDVYSSVLACFITLDGANVNQSMVANNTAHTSITSSLGEGNHLWNATCADLANNTNTSETRNFNVFIPPQVVRLSPANGTTTNNQTIAFLFNVSDETGIANCSLLIDEAYNETKSTAAITHNGTNNFTVTFGTSVRLQWAIICVDNTSYASANRTDNRTLTIDLAPPNPQFVTANSTWFSTATPTITFNITDNFDTNISYTLFIDGVANVSGYVANGTNANLVLGALANGTYTLIMQGTDDAPNAANSTPLTIYVDTAAPNVTLLTPANGSTMNTTSVVLNFTANDNMAPWLICNLTLDGAVIQSNINLTNGSMYNTTVTAATGTHYWNATCIDLAANRGTSQSWSFIIQAPDLIITAGNITVSNNTPIENQTIVVNATIFNIGNLAASNITVQFYDGDPSFGGVQIGANQTIANLGIGGNTSLNTTYLAHIGLNRIYVVVDPPIATNGTISEENESNNIAYAAFVVGLFEVFSGISSNTLRISDALIIDAFTWNQTETSGSNIFVADSESTITFPALMAIGRNTTNGTGTGANDFEEIDARINATNLTDNVNATFTSTGIPLGLRNITAYKRPIIDIPFINSTNSTNFMTGIVWDANDGGPYYNGSQDVAFVSVINQSMQGLYGIYDYEVLVPATLRDYIPGGGTVTFYVELR